MYCCIALHPTCSRIHVKSVKGLQEACSLFLSEPSDPGLQCQTTHTESQCGRRQLPGKKLRAYQLLCGKAKQNPAHLVNHSTTLCVRNESNCPSPPCLACLVCRSSRRPRLHSPPPPVYVP